MVPRTAHFRVCGIVSATTTSTSSALNFAKHDKESSRHQDEDHPHFRGLSFDRFWLWFGQRNRNVARYEVALGFVSHSFRNDKVPEVPMLHLAPWPKWSKSPSRPMKKMSHLVRIIFLIIVTGIGRMATATITITTATIVRVGPNYGK